jgi:hypothetical protein
MDREFTEEEVKNVIDQMEKNKAAGPDGFPMEFYQTCREIVKDDLMVLFRDFHQHIIDQARINYGTIILIPKIDELLPFRNSDQFVCCKSFSRFSLRC